MKFDFLSLADAANQTPDGKVNVLGLGARIVTFRSLPAAAPLVIIGSIAASREEAGHYTFRVFLKQPDGSQHLVVEFPGSITADVTDPRVPTGIGFTIGLSRPFTQEGVHHIISTIGDLEAEWVFAVRVSAPADEAQGNSPRAEGGPP